MNYNHIKSYGQGKYSAVGVSKPLYREGGFWYGLGAVIVLAGLYVCLGVML